jgi:hypothetical protein
LFCDYCSTDSLARGFGFKSAADYEIQMLLIQLDGAVDINRIKRTMITCKCGTETRRLVVPERATTWRFIAKAMHVSVIDVRVKISDGDSFLIHTPSDIINGDTLLINASKLALYCCIS